MACKVNADCGTGACVALKSGATVCAPSEFGGIAGIYPEEVCLEAATCGIYTDQNGCNAFFQGANHTSGCLGNLTQGELSQWIDAVTNCLSITSCASVTTCFDALPYCTFTAN